MIQPLVILLKIFIKVSLQNFFSIFQNFPFEIAFDCCSHAAYVESRNTTFRIDFNSRSKSVFVHFESKREYEKSWRNLRFFFFNSFVISCSKLSLSGGVTINRHLWPVRVNWKNEGNHETFWVTIRKPLPYYMKSRMLFPL